MGSIPCHVDLFTVLISLLSLKFTIFIHLSHFKMTLTLLILSVCGTPVTYELGKVTLLSMSSHSSMVPTQCSGGYGLDT